MTKFIQKFYLGTYKTLSLGFFIVLLAVIIGYSGLVLFYIFNNSWGIPLVLSPEQPRVLAFQPQVSTLVHNVAKSRAELQTALVAKKAILEQLIRIDELSIRLEKTVKNEINFARKSSNLLDHIIGSKQQNSSASKELLDTVNQLNDQIDTELSAGLITKDQAMQRRMALQSSNILYSDQKLTVVQTELQSSQAKDYASTLAGINKSLAGLAPSKQLLELESSKAQLNIQLDTINRNFDILKNSIAANTRILQVSTESPYYKALWEPVTVLFLPYNNLDNATENAKVYSCRLEMIFCSEVGNIDKVFPAEEYGKHPLFKTDIRGKFATIIFTDRSAAKNSVLFIGSKPLFL